MRCGVCKVNEACGASMGATQVCEVCHDLYATDEFSCA